MNTLKLARLLTQDGYQITLFAQENAILLQKEIAIFQTEVVVKKNRKYFDFSTAKMVAKQLKISKISLVFVVDNKDLDVLGWTKRLFFRKLKIIYQQHMQIGINKKDPLHTFRFRAVDTWISPLDFLKTEIGQRTHFPLSRVEVIPIGLDTKQFLIPTYSKTDARQKMKISTEFPLLGIIGRISRKKGQRFVVECLLALKNQGIHLELVIFGSATVNDVVDQKYAIDLRKYVSINGLDEYVHFVDFQEDVKQFYNAIDVFVLASHSETYGMVTIEAMLSGVPVIATNSGGTTGILESGRLGLLYNYENVQEFCNLLQIILKDTEGTKEMVLKAKEAASRLYDSKSEIEAIKAVFNRYNA